MHPQIALREITAAAVNFTNLCKITGNNLDARADAVAIALHADRLDQNRIVCTAAIISQQLRRAVQIVNYHVDVAIVIDVTKGRPSARALLNERRAELLSDFGKRAVAVVVMHKIALPVSV